ncbi:methyl-accepting chemotaxis protein [Heliorestis acidaminivorans]|uniref:Methyl-accepting chemotaxis protein n=1 Tax=Heliorestis acidaminivorans TaxID=553427 RepID=A0A6I0F2A7_9FIRM|nr:methyl-accepting chemotaxis protein [Heliorestis acidaminivorans]KAB2953448.1 methyl-accepting chemotaxis protein [Heliorestis acidaminivorans]
MRLNIKDRLLLFIVSTLVVVLTIAILSGAFMTRQIVQELSDNEVLLLAQEQAAEAKNFLDKPMAEARALAEAMAVLQQKGQTDRETAHQIMRNLVEKNEEYLGVWTLWEPNAFDGNDQAYINAPGHDETGRFIPYWVKSGNRIVLQPCDNYEIPGYGDYYLIPKATREETIMEPYTYLVDGQEVTLVSLVVPVLLDNRFVGVVGIDVALHTFIEKHEAVKIFDSGSVHLITNEGTFVTFRDTSFVGTNIAELDGGKHSPVLDALRKKEPILTELYSNLLGEQIVTASVPFYIGNSTTPWAVGAMVPLKEIYTKANDLLFWQIGFGLAGILIMSAIVYWVAHFIATPLRNALTGLENVAQGDFRTKMAEKDLARSDEVGQIAVAVETMTKNMKEAIVRIAQVAEELSASGQELSATTQTVSANMEEVSASSEEISASMETLSASAEEISASSEETVTALTQLYQEATVSCSKAQEVNARANDLVTKAGTSYQQAGNIYESINSKMNQAIKEAKIVTEIAHLADSIADISAQTNLLALNAAIEASHAGEQGRGFAVVADEVRKLANHSADSVQNIQKVTRKVQLSIESLVESSQEVMSFLNTQVKRDYESFVEVGAQYQQDAQAFQQIVTETSKLTKEVLASTTEVSNAMVQVTEMVNQANRGTTEIARGAEHTSEAINDVTNTAVNQAQMAEELDRLVKKFKL